MQKEIQERLQGYFGVDTQVDFHDEKGDGKHFYLDICSEKFRGLSRIDQSKLVYSVLDQYMKTGYIHALRMKCRVPDSLKN